MSDKENGFDVAMFEKCYSAFDFIFIGLFMAILFVVWNLFFDLGLGYIIPAWLFIFGIMIFLVRVFERGLK